MVEKIKVCWGIGKEYVKQLKERYGIELVTYSSDTDQEGETINYANNSDQGESPEE